jgi:hypothetical protein
MDMLSKVALILFAAFLGWMLFRFIKSNPESLSFSNLNKSFFAMGILGVSLIAFVAAVVMLLRST